MKNGVEKKDGLKGDKMFRFRATQWRRSLRKMISESEAEEEKWALGSD